MKNLLFIMVFMAVSIAHAQTQPIPVADTLKVYSGSIYVKNLLLNDIGADKKITSFKVKTTSYAIGKTATMAGIGTIKIMGDGIMTFTSVKTYTGPAPDIQYTINNTIVTKPGKSAKILITIIPQPAPDSTYLIGKNYIPVIKPIKDNCKDTGNYYASIIIDREYYGIIMNTTFDGLTGNWLFDNRAINQTTALFLDVNPHYMYFIRKYGCLR